MIKSESIVELAKALAKAQSEIKNASKDSTNPHFKSTYADIASVWNAIRGPLTSNGLSILQTVAKHETDWVVETTLLHGSGQFFTGQYPIQPNQPGPQGFKSAVTYAKRTSLEGIAGVAGEDDDANTATAKPLQAPRPVQAQVQRPQIPNMAKNLAQHRDKDLT